MVLFAATPAFAGEARVYTDEDLEKYKGQMYDQETITRTETELRAWEREKEAGEKLHKEKKEAEEIRKEGQRPSDQSRNKKTRKT
jgi:hypothetical protein